MLDQIVKAWVRATLPVVGQKIVLWPGVFEITHEQNHGMAFSLLQGEIPLLSLAAILVIAVIVAVQIRAGARMPALQGIALALPLGGAVGNLIDRLWQHYVTDLFYFKLINFPVFNVADAAISVGVALLAWRTLTQRDENSSDSRHPSLSPPTPVSPGEGAAGG